MTQTDSLYQSFLNPGPEWRGKPFWSWNGDLDEAELIRQVHVLKEMGMGGFFMHSRTGLVTEYLGDEWFRLINACADEAEKLGMEAWLYDEDRWPSGTAGGLVTEDPAHRLNFLRLATLPMPEFSWEKVPDGFVAAFVCRLSGDDGLEASDVRRLTPGEAFSGIDDGTILLFSVEELAKWEFYNGYTYVDTMSRAATDAFIRVTHEKYLERCGDRLGKSIKGIFTDEPHRGAIMSGFSVQNENSRWLAPWTGALPEEYKDRFDKDLLSDLPAIFLRVEGHSVSPAKWRYMELTQQLFLENFLKPLYEWCTSQNLRLTGHVLNEDSLTAQAAMQGSLMRSYEWMHDPGIDILTERNRCFWAAKQLQSAAHQLGRKWLLSELYGCTGWQFDFAGHKAVGDWQALLGINVRCHHLSWYTMAGEAKRDYPASILHQSAWWKDYNGAVETYFSRLGLLLSTGERVCDVLVLNPVESVNAQIHAAWANSLNAADPAIQTLETQYAELFGWLTGARIDFDYGDEEMLSRLGSVDGNRLQLGAARYRTVLVGGMTTMRTSTVALLHQFADAGGRVIFAGDPPAFVDAELSDSPQIMAASTGMTSVAWVKNAVCSAAAVGASFIVDVRRIEDGASPVESLLSQVRKDGDTWIVALLNTDREKGVGRVRIRLNADTRLPMRVEEWNCREGTRRAMEAQEAEDGGIFWETAFAPGGEHVYVIGETSEPPALPKPKWETTANLPAPGPYAYTLGEPNVLVLDTAAWRIDDGVENAPVEVLKADIAVRDAFGLPHRSGHMVQPWYRRRTEPPPPILGRVSLRFVFSVETVPTGPVFLAIERPERWSATVNGVPIAAAPDGWWVDIAFARLSLPPGALRPGPNEIILTADFTSDLGIEAAYLLGDFGVRLTDDGLKTTITSLPATLTSGDLTTQGLPFYGGPVTLEIPMPRAAEAGESLELWLPEGLNAACAKVISSGEPRYLAFAPLMIPIDADANSVALEVVLTRRNTFGPLHQVPLHTPWYGPGNWLSSGEGWSDVYQLWPSGLPEPPVIWYGRKKSE